MPWPKGVPHPFEPYRRRRQRWSDGTWLRAFFAKVNVVESGCWEWTAYRSTRNGLTYGRVYRQGQWKYAHRAFWEVVNGPVPAGLDLDHLCRNSICVNLGHLEPVTRSENVLRSWAARKAGL